MFDLGINPLLIAILAPLVVAVVILSMGGRVSERVVYPLAFIGFLIPAAAAVWAFCGYLSSGAVGLDSYIYTYQHNVGLSPWGIQLYLGLNGIAAPMFLLSGVVGLAAGLYAIQSEADSKGTYLGLLLLMLAGLMGTFSSVDVFFYYLFHEFALIPTFIMIGYWGGRGRRSIALEVTIYLTVGAMITLIGLIALYVQSGADYFTMIELREVLRDAPLGESTQQSIVWLLIIGFGILVALWPFHTWAPRAYAAAPSSAAMLHAGVLKKFGLYGLIQIAAPMLPEGMEWGATWLIPLALANVLVVGFVTMAQRDLKLMLGYSSVMHMGYIFLAISTLTILGVGAAVMLMVAHGFVVALLLMLATSIHKRTGTLDLKAMGGLGTQAPVLAALFIAAMLANIGLPGFANFWGELLVFVSLSAFYPLPVTLAAIGIVISAVYGLRAVSRIFFGEHSAEMKATIAATPIGDIHGSERVPALLLLAALLFFGFWPKPLLECTQRGLVTQEPTLMAPSDAPIKATD